METQITDFLSQPQVVPFLQVAPWVLGALIIWTVIWKGLALWKAARRGSKAWFIVLLIVNTVGILELIYVLFVGRGKPKQEQVQ